MAAESTGKDEPWTAAEPTGRDSHLEIENWGISNSMILDFRPDLSSHNSWRLLHAFLLFVLGFCALPADLEETACPNVLTGPAAKNDTKWLSFTTTLSDEVAAADQQDKVGTAQI